MRPEIHNTAWASAHPTAAAVAGWQLIGAGLALASRAPSAGAPSAGALAPFSALPLPQLIEASCTGSSDARGSTEAADCTKVAECDRMDGVSHGSEQELWM